MAQDGSKIAQEVQATLECVDLIFGSAEFLSVYRQSITAQAPMHTFPEIKTFIRSPSPTH